MHTLCLLAIACRNKYLNAVTLSDTDWHSVSSASAVYPFSCSNTLQRIVCSCENAYDTEHMRAASSTISDL